MGVMVYFTGGLEASCAYHILNNVTLYIISGFGVQTVATDLKITNLLTDILIQGVFIAVTAFLARKINGKTTVE